MDSGPARVVSSRLEIEKDGKVGYLQFDTDDRGWMTIWHTEVPPELRGHGIATELVKTAFDYARNNHLHVDVTCPIATSLATKHPEYQALIGKKARESDRQDDADSKASVDSGRMLPLRRKVSPQHPI
ncbi:MAG: N-acetyltransferase [Silvibacterium sp.]|nr:N-acetyltransferase [Silvibacterium sp.]